MRQSRPTPKTPSARRAAPRGGGRKNRRKNRQMRRASVRSEGDQTGCSLALLSLSVAHFHCVPLKPLCRAPAERSIRSKECHAASAPLKRAAADRRPAAHAKRRRLPQSRSRKKEGKKEGGKREEGGKKGEKREEIKKTAACRGGFFGVAGSSPAAKIRGALSRRGG